MSFTLCLGLKRGEMVHSTAIGYPSFKLALEGTILFSVVTTLLLVSAVFLADALRRLKKSFSQDKRLVVS